MRISIALCLLALAAVLLSIPSAPSCADSWSLPSATTYASCAGNARITVTPRDLEDQLAYFEDKSNGVDPAGQSTGGHRVASAQLERRFGKQWRVIWDRPIANDVAPVEAIVRDDGAYVVTFDDWHGTGHGPNAVAIYGAGGQLVRALSLNELVPDDYIKALPHSVSSIDWRREPHFSRDGRQAVIPVVIPSMQDMPEPDTVDIGIRLSDGAVSPADPVAWRAALEQGRKVLAARDAAAATEKAAFLAPLTGPKANTQGDWHTYLREAVSRLAGDDVVLSTTVLRLPSADDYAISEKWVREALTDRDDGAVALASLSQPNLAKVLRKIATELPRRSLSNVTVFIVLSGQDFSSAATAMKPTGAKLVQLDPGKAIPQRPERIARRYGSD